MYASDHQKFGLMPILIFGLMSILIFGLTQTYEISTNAYIRIWTNACAPYLTLFTPTPIDFVVFNILTPGILEENLFNISTQYTLAKYITLASEA